MSIINIGCDTDTSVGLAGIYYGQKKIPEHWIPAIARRKYIIELGEKLNKKSGV